MHRQGSTFVLSSYELGTSQLLCPTCTMPMAAVDKNEAGATVLGCGCGFSVAETDIENVPPGLVDAQAHEDLAEQLRELAAWAAVIGSPRAVRASARLLELADAVASPQALNLPLLLQVAQNARCSQDEAVREGGVRLERLVHLVAASGLEE